MTSSQLGSKLEELRATERFLPVRGVLSTICPVHTRDNAPCSGPPPKHPTSTEAGAVPLPIESSPSVIRSNNAPNAPSTAGHRAATSATSAAASAAASVAIGGASLSVLVK